MEELISLDKQFGQKLSLDNIKLIARSNIGDIVFMGTEKHKITKMKNIRARYILQIWGEQYV